MDFYELKRKIIEKKLLRSILLFVLGLTLLLFSVINGVSSCSIERATFYPKESDYYPVEVKGVVESYGCFSLQSAEVVVQIINGDGMVLGEKTLRVGVNGRFSLNERYATNNRPRDVVAKVTKIRFNNTWAVILSSGILVVSVVDFILKIKKPKEERTK